MLVEPTRSQNITVRWRRSPAASTEAEIGGGAIAARIGAGMTGTMPRRRCKCTAQRGDRLHATSLPMAERHDADVLEIVVGQPAQQLPVDVVGAERLGILERDRFRGANRQCSSSVPWVLINGSF